MISGRAVSVVAIGIVAVAFAGGAVSGQLQRTRSASTVPATATATTTTESPVVNEVLVVETDAVDDMSLDLSSQRLDPDRQRRVALAQAPGVVAERHADVALAWAPDQVATTEAAYDKLVIANAANPAVPSVTAATFEVTRWGLVTIKGDVATAACVGHYVLAEPAAPRGVVSEPDQAWAMTLRLGASGDWQMETRTAA